VFLFLAPYYFTGINCYILFESSGHTVITNAQLTILVHLSFQIVFAKRFCKAMKSPACSLHYPVPKTQLDAGNFWVMRIFRARIKIYNVSLKNVPLRLISQNFTNSKHLFI